MWFSLASTTFYTGQQWGLFSGNIAAQQPQAIMDDALHWASEAELTTWIASRGVAGWELISQGIKLADFASRFFRALSPMLNRAIASGSKSHGGIVGIDFASLDKACASPPLEPVESSPPPESVVSLSATASL